MYKRIAHIALTLLFLSTMLSLQGCNNEPIEPVVNEAPKVFADEIEEISFGIWELRQPQSDASFLVYDYIKQNFKIDLKPITLSIDNWQSELDWMMGANQLPDVFVHDILGNKFQYKQLITTGAIRELPKEMWGQMQRLSEVLSWYEEIYAVDEKMYFIPRTYQTFDQTHGATDVIFYRNDWAKDLSYTSFGETARFIDIIELLGAYRASDPDGNTVWDTWGITGSGGIDFLWSAFLTPFGVRDWVQEDGQWIPGLLSDSAKEAMAWAAQLYRDGIIDPDIATQTKERAMQKFLSGKAGMILASAYHGHIEKFEEQWNVYNPDTSVQKSIKILPSYITPMDTINNEVETFQGGSLISGNVNDSKMYKILSLFNWMYDNEGRNYLTFGQ